MRNDVCDGCKLCTLVCPANVLELVDDPGSPLGARS